MGMRNIFNAAIAKLVRNTDNKGVMSEIASAINPYDMEILVVRGKNCEVLFSNTEPGERINNNKSEDFTCRSVYAKSLQSLCDYCPNGGKSINEDGNLFELKDTNDNTFKIRRNTITWIDGKSATIFMMRNITSEIEAQQHLYNLAYIDQLTGIPNRQKLKEDFARLGQKIESNEVNGLVAIFDLDHFKTVNDSYGHNSGDAVLCRLAEHLSEDLNFKNNIYRLGGDEFVFFFSSPSDEFESFDIMKDHYNSILQSALKAYTLPNIDIKCTLSMGVSFFPKHGVTLSDTLRKADIALYKAKDAGRNTLVFFEDAYDTAQKFNDMYINIMPILLSAGKTFGYELVDKEQVSEEDDGTVTLSEFNRTLDALGLNDIENNLYYFITFSKQLLNPTVLENLPKDKFIVQISLPSTMSQNSTDNTISLLKLLRKSGYKVVLSGVNSNNSTVELLNFVDYCKFSPSDKNTQRQKLLISKNQKIRFIATEVNSINDFNTAKQIGFHLFQGFYFSNPPVEKQKTKEISPMKINYFRLMKLASTRDYMNFKEISDIIASDVALSYKLLRILNSAAVGLRNVSSISSAVAYMGEENLKKWIAVLALRGIAEDKPLELVRMSLIRARFGELLSPNFRIKRNPQQVFMVGLLSLLHIALDVSKEKLLEDIPVAEDIHNSLLTRTGIFSDLIRFYENYEYANWNEVTQFAYDNNLDSHIVNDSYVAAVKWYNDLANA